VIVDIEKVRRDQRLRKQRQRDRDLDAVSRGDWSRVTKEGHARLSSYGRSQGVTKSVTDNSVTGLVTRVFQVAAVLLLVTELYINVTTAWSQGVTVQSRIAFLGVGIGADLIEFVSPTVGSIWKRQGRWARSATAWCIWLVCFAYSLLASSGFAAMNLADTTTLRAAQITPAVELAQRKADTLTASRADECKRRGDRCRALETEEQKALDDLKAERAKVAEDANPQATKTAALITWFAPGSVSADDITKVWLLLMTLVPHLGGVLLMVARR
jgi:hypothetical protein